MRIVRLALLVLVIVPTWASEPGQPLDCSDWVSVEAGLTCVPLLWPCNESPWCNLGGQSDPNPVRVVDNSGRLIRVEQVNLGPRTDCPTTSIVQLRLLGSSNGVSEDLLGYWENRCQVPGIAGQDLIGVRKELLFDPKSGSLYISLQSGCSGQTCSTTSGYDSVNWLARIQGFATDFEVLQTYTPTTGLISFRVPYMPEGFQYANYFDTYYGDLATVGDWSQALPLQCGYPATAPSVGDYLAVDDTLPIPSPGQGYYFVTAVNYQGQRRYGRRSNGGVLSGRDPAVLPECVE